MAEPFYRFFFNSCFFFAERYFVVFSSLLFSQWRESEQTWISSAIDCLPYNSSFYPGKRVHRWIWISTMRPATFYHLAAVTLGRIFISSSVSSLFFFSFDLFSRTRKLIQRMIVPILFPCVNVTGPLAIPLAMLFCYVSCDTTYRSVVPHKIVRSSGN